MVFWWEFVTNNFSAWLLTYLVHSTVVFGAFALVARRMRFTARTENRLWRVGILLPTLTASARIAVEHTNGSGFVEGPEALTVMGSVGEIVISTAIGAFLVSLLLAGRFGRAVRRERDQLASRVPVEDAGLVEMLDRVAQESGSRPPRLTQSRAIGAPIALPGGEVCLPTHLLDRLTDEGAKAVLAHELAHLTHGDTAWAGAAQLLERVFFFQPLHRHVTRRIRETSEFLADDFAVRHTGDPEHLIGALTTFARASTDPVTASSFAPGSLLVRRVRRVLSGEERSAKGWVWAVVGLSVVVVLLAWFSPAVVPACDCLLTGL